LPATRYNRSMIETPQPLAPALWATLSAPERVPLLEQLATLRLENAALREQNAVLEQRVRELEARLGQNSSNSSRPPSSDPPQVPAKQRAVSSGRRRGGQPGHRGAFRVLLPVEQVDEVVVVVPQVCRHCEQRLPASVAHHRSQIWRHQVVELLPLAVRVTEYQMAVRRCPTCGKRTRAGLPAGVPRRPFGAGLTAVIALLSGRYRLSRREVRELLQDLWQVRVSLGAVVRQEQAQSAALAPVVEEARAAVGQADVVNVDETGWQQGGKRAWLWTVVAAGLTVFHVDRSRGGTAVAAMLGAEFGGVVGSNRWSAYSRFPAQRRALCWAHLKRAFQGLVDRGGEAELIGCWGLAEIERLFTLCHRFRAGEFGRDELRRSLIPLQARLGRLLRRGQDNPDGKAVALCRQFQKCWPALWTFARVDGVEPTNNGAERALRPAVLWRKGSFGSDSEAGSRFAARLLTVAASCRQQARPLLGFLVAAGEAALRGSPPPSLLAARLD
jgi:transposase